MKNISRPYPQQWTARYAEERQHDLSLMSRTQRDEFLVRNNINRAQAATARFVNAKVSESYIHNGEEFVMLDTQAGIVHVRWTGVSEFAVDGHELALSDDAVGMVREEVPEPDIDPLPGREGPFTYKEYPYFTYPDGRVDGLTHNGWYRLESLTEYARYVDGRKRD